MKNTFFRFLCLFTCITLVSCTKIEILSDPAGPIWIENSSTRTCVEPSQNLKFVTYNIQFGEDIPVALAEFQIDPNLMNPDIVFLQEIDTFGVQELAKHLDMNHLYIPALNRGKDLQYFGNGILSSCEIQNEEKIILPHLAPGGGQRIATYASIDLNETTLHLYSVHLETIKMRRKKRKEQLQYILDHALAHDSDDPVIISGDLNSFFKKDRNQFQELIEEYGYAWESEKLDYTSEAFFGIFKKPIDHIYARGIEVDTIGVITHATASDHYPVFATINIQ